MARYRTSPRTRKDPKIDPGTIVLRILAATALMLAVAATVYAASRGHIFLFPFVLILGVPLAALFGRPPAPPPR